VTSAELVWRNAKTNFNGKVVKGMNEKFLEVGDVMQILGISRSAAYKLMRQINSELEKKGYIVIRGKVSRKYFEERIYGMSDAG
jgi:ABC-type histidine transport system ATPase subunit